MISKRFDTVKLKKIWLVPVVQFLINMLVQMKQAGLLLVQKFIDIHNLEPLLLQGYTEFCTGNKALKRNNMNKSVFYHAGCPVCVQAELEILQLIGADRVEVVHLATDKTRITEAATAGVQSVPALVTPSGSVLHINFGAALSDLG